jgi:diaminohydroxyphosphoribosylaminopyrimidine deaminase/5-amino-6-(5-phosphoribosylamino)uracil reductase
LANFLRSKYDCLLTTSKTINDDDPLLNCRIEGLERKSPDLIILDRSFKIKKDIQILKSKNKKIYILTNIYNSKKEKFFKKNNIKIIKLKKKSNQIDDLKNIFYMIKKLGYNRILVESGTTFLEQLIKYDLIKNFYLFKSPKNLARNGLNNNNPVHLKKISISRKDKIKVNLKGDTLYKVKI